MHQPQPPQHKKESMLDNTKKQKTPDKGRFLFYLQSNFN